MRSLRLHLCLSGAILIVLGVLSMRYPLEAIMSAGVIIGIGLTVSGINHFSGWYFLGLKRFIVMGILDIITGIIMVAQPGITAFVIPIVMALWLFSSGITRTCISFWLGGAKVPGWWMMLLGGLASVFLAVLVMASPLVASVSVMMMLSGVLIACGVLAILEGCIMCR